jgi:beta-glucosidase
VRHPARETPARAGRRSLPRLAMAPAGLALAALACAGAPRATRPVYRDPAAPVEARVRDLLGRMTLEEKFWQLYMVPGDLDAGDSLYRHGIYGLQIGAAAARPASALAGADSTTRAAAGDAGTVAREAAERINAIQRFFVERTRLGIPIIPFDEALHGLVRDGATSFPQAIGLAATWDTALVDSVARAIARETAARGVRQVLSPVLNIASDVRWGRVEETFGEDPFLASRMGVAYVAPFEAAGVVATPKHFVANVGDGGRDSYPIDFDERLLNEIFFPPFRAAIGRGGARSIMASYNSVNGTPATANAWLLTRTLRRDWGFRGVAIGDAGATGGANVLHFTSRDYMSSTAAAITAGLDVIFQSSAAQAPLFWEAFRSGRIDRATIDQAVGRVLRLKFELGLFEYPYVDPADAARWSGSPAHLALARQAARSSITLLRNERGTLPLSRSLRSLAVLGVDATEARSGGYSGPGVHRVSILDGIRATLGAGTEVRFAPGPGREAREFVPIPGDRLLTTADGRTVPGLRAEYFDNITLASSPRLTRIDPRVDFGWTLHSPARELPFDWYSVRWTGRLVARTSGAVRIGVEGNDGFRLYVDDSLLIDNWRKQSYRTLTREVRLEAGRAYALRLEYFESTGNGRIRLVWDDGVDRDWSARVDDAVRLVRASDAAVIVAGLEEGEFRDRASLRLPGRQEELILATAATGKPVVVVIVGGSAVTMGAWLDRVGAVIDAWYPGDEGGNAVADVLFGDYNPAGRLPITFPISEGQLPLVYNHKPTGRGDDYRDLTGQPLFPFGFGLSYSTFDYSALVIEPGAIAPGDSATVRCSIRNAGPFPGDEVVELFLRDVVASVARPVMELAAFRRVHLDVGESREVTFRLTPEQLGMFDQSLRRVVEPGAFRVMVGRSARDIRLRGELTVR